jgi:butyryl-CoA dehydrogenase
MKNIKGKVVVVTGAGSGIGQALAIQFAREGCFVALNDINPQYLEETKNIIEKSGGKASIHLADIGLREDVEQLSEEVLRQYGRVDMLINNAGVSLARLDVQEVSWEDWEWMMKVNFWGKINCTKIFYPHLQKQREAHIVNISSVFGLNGVRKRAAYCASKFAVRGFTESMIHENKGTNIRISLVLPGGVATKISKHSRGWGDNLSEQRRAHRLTLMSKTSAQEAARIIIRGIKRNKKRILVGMDARLMDVITRLFPQLSGSIIHFAIARGEKRLAGNL